MSKDLEKYMESRRSDLPKTDKQPPQERAALMKLRAEAQKNRAKLATGGKGGLPSSLVLGVFRRDKYHCKACGTKGDDKNGLSVHHKGGIPESTWLSKKGHHNDPNNLTVICENCHDRIHEKARDEGVDSSQVTPQGDVGDKRRDHGKPVAKP